MTWRREADIDATLAAILNELVRVTRALGVAEKTIAERDATIAELRQQITAPKDEAAEPTSLKQRKEG